ncbi:hypothetical protein ABC383_00640 [Noviherbaspirillum sp. 1P10PC]|uniref:hypothetical protein n=1 Tax=Noviherbaspirillum sp. 1P10PC TaxID=3132292 RepID=UPI0039A1C66A
MPMQQHFMLLLSNQTGLTEREDPEVFHIFASAQQGQATAQVGKAASLFGKFRADPGRTM